MDKLISKDEFRFQIKTVKNIAVTGFRWSGTPQLLLRLIRKEFDKSGKPNGITIMFTSSATDPGLDHLAHPDLLKCSYGSYYGSIPKVRKLIQQNKIEGYSLPQGQLSLLFREIGRGSPGLVSSVGKHTYIDPINGGGRLNEKTKNNAVNRLKINSQNFLFYKSKRVDAAIIRGSTADKYGNISMEDEPVKTEFLSMAQAARASGGKIFIQVAKFLDVKLSPNKIDLPSHLVDGIVIAEDLENYHRHTNKYVTHKGFLTNDDYNLDIQKSNDPFYKLIIGRRALKEIKPNDNVILGQGVPEIVGVLARKNYKKYKNMMTFMESGVIGGIPERRPDFGVAFSPSSFLTQDNQFVGFNGGHIDLAILSFVQFDQVGNVNVSVLGEDYFGCGGYIDICHGVKKIIFVGTFTAKGLEVSSLKNKIKVEKEGLIQKAVTNVDEITFSPKLQKEKGQEILIVTERCVFKIINEKVHLVEVTKGVDIKKEIIDQMSFLPIISSSLK